MRLPWNPMRGGPKLALVASIAMLALVVSGTSSAAQSVTCYEKLGGKLVEILCPTPVVASSSVTTKTAGQTRTNPFKLGTAGYTAGFAWKVAVSSVNTNAWSVVQGANATNKAPRAGYNDVLVTITATYNGPDTGAGFDLVSNFAVATAKGASYGASPSACGIVPNDAAAAGDYFNGGVLTGNLCFQVPTSVARSLELYWNAFGAKAPWWALH